MPPLTAHLQDLDAHGKLPFHPACPICQHTRLAGGLPTGGVLSARAPALLAIGAMAASTAAPAVTAAAAEPDKEQSGTSTVAPSAPPDPASDPDFDPGGGSTELPALPAQPAQPPPPVAQPQAPPAVEPEVEAPPSTGTDPVVDPGDGTDPTEAKAPTSPTAPPPQAPPGSSEPVAPATPEAPPPPAPVAAPEPAANPVESQETSADSGEPTERTASLRATKGKEPRSHANTATSQSVPTPAPTVPTAPAAGTATVAAQPSGPPAEPGDRRHTVQPGESLWVIASDLLGGEASPAQIAREVHRLWQLNHERIGTGDPDLLIVGTKLRLR